MSELLNPAMAVIQTLPESEQDAFAQRCLRQIASLILAEVEDEERWEDLFSRSEDVLAKLATSAMAEYHAGETQELDPETL